MIQEVTVRLFRWGKKVLELGLVAGLVLGVSLAWGQSAPRPAKKVVLERLVIEGTRRTKDFILRRELSLKPGDTLAYADTAQLFKQNANQLFNTRLFLWTEVGLSQIHTGDSLADRADLFIRVKERWFTWPIPILELADRSFNEWYYNRGAQLNRVNYGIRLTQHNLTGHRDALKLTFQQGFTQRYDLQYTFPYLGKGLNAGLTFDFSYATNKQVAVFTDANKQVFFQDELGGGRVRSHMGLGYSQRQGLFATHSVTLAYHANRISDTLAQLNPNYFLDYARKQEYGYAAYQFVYDFRDRRNYPLKGWHFHMTLERFGLLARDNMNLSALQAYMGKFWPLGERWFAAAGMDMHTSTPGQQPYYNIRNIGFNDRIIRGYDRYMLEGPHAVVGKASVRYKLFSTVQRLENIPIEQFRTVPVELYLKAYGDLGYVDNAWVRPGNERLINALLPGYGLGLDWVTFYDVVLRFEYSFNKMGEGNLFIYLKSDI